MRDAGHSVGIIHGGYIYHFIVNIYINISLSQYQYYIYVFNNNIYLYETLGDMDKEVRDKVMDEFRRGTTKVLENLFYFFYSKILII